MEFAKYYNVSNLVEEMQKAEEIDCYPTDNDKFEGVYVCMDTNDFWISRINKGYNEEYEREDGKYLVERNKISIYDVMDKLHELYSKKLPDFKENDLQFEMKNKCHDYLKKLRQKIFARQLSFWMIMMDYQIGIVAKQIRWKKLLKLLMVDMEFCH